VLRMRHALEIVRIARRLAVAILGIGGEHMPSAINRERLKKLYPTAESLENARKKYKDWGHMAKALGMRAQILYDYKDKLGVATEKAVRKVDILALTAADIEKGIKKLIGDNTANVVTRYKVTDPIFYEDTTGNNGLELVGVEKGTTFNQACRESCKFPPYRVY